MVCRKKSRIGKRPRHDLGTSLLEEGSSLASKAAAKIPKERRIQIQKWIDMLLVNPAATLTGKDIEELAQQDECFAKRLDTLEDVFSKKATNTLRARSGSLCSYLSWGFKRGMESRWLIPVQEPTLYEFLTQLRHEGAAPTKAASVMSAVTFVTH